VVMACGQRGWSWRLVMACDQRVWSWRLVRACGHGVMRSPSSHRGAFPQQPVARSRPPMAPDPRKGDRSSRMPQCMLRSKSSLNRLALCMGTTTSHPTPSIPPHPTPSHPTSPAPAEHPYRPPRGVHGLLPGQMEPTISGTLWGQHIPGGKQGSLGIPLIPRRFRRRWPVPPLRSNDHGLISSLRNSPAPLPCPHCPPKWRNLFPLNIWENFHDFWRA
jgi:hypothetical protein